MKYDAKAKKTADRLIRRFGQPVTLIQAASGAYNPATSSATVGSSNFPGYAVVSDEPSSTVPNSENSRQDKQVSLSIAGVIPTDNDKLVIGGLTHTIISVKTLAPAGSAIMFDLVCRVGA